MGGICGRLPKVTGVKVARILEWARNRKTRAQLAQELGITETLVGHVIARRGQYKSASPEDRARNLRERREKVKRYRARWQW